MDNLYTNLILIRKIMANIMKFLRIVKIEVIFLVIFQCSTKERKKKGGKLEFF